jgi:hypothetical protein
VGRDNVDVDLSEVDFDERSARVRSTLGASLGTNDRRPSLVVGASQVLHFHAKRGYALTQELQRVASVPQLPSQFVNYVPQS